MANQVKTVLLLTGLTGLLLFIGGALGGQGGVIIAFVLALLMNFFSYWFSDKIVLKMYKAKEVSPSDSPVLHSIIEELSRNAEIPKPKIYVVENDSPNAFATGRNPKHAAVAVTTGLIKLLNEREIKGVLSHELSHIKHRDTLISAVSATIAGAIMFLVRIAQFSWIFGVGGDDDNGGGLIQMLVFIIVGPLAALIIQMAISRSREFYADEEGAKISSDPLALAHALSELETYSKRIPMTNAKETTAHFFIINPFSGKSLMKLFSTHPPTEERIKRLEEMARI
jgi:heat shock protein HtpX